MAADDVKEEVKDEEVKEEVAVAVAAEVKEEAMEEGEGAAVAGQKRKADDGEDADAAAAGEDGPIAVEEPDAKKVKVEQKVWVAVKMGPKTFASPDDMIKYFSWILNNQTVNQVGRGAHLNAATCSTLWSLVS